MRLLVARSSFERKIGYLLGGMVVFQAGGALETEFNDKQNTLLGEIYFWLPWLTLIRRRHTTHNTPLAANGIVDARRWIVDATKERELGGGLAGGGSVRC